MKKITLATLLILGLTAPVASAQAPMFTYDTSRLPANVIGGGVGAKFSAGAAQNKGFSNTQGFGFYATQVQPGFYEYNTATFQGGSVTIGAGGYGYLGTLFNRFSIFVSGAGGASFTPVAIGQVFQTGGDVWWGIHKTKAGNKFVVGAGGERDFSNQPGVDSYNLRAMFGYSF